MTGEKQTSAQRRRFLGFTAALAAGAHPLSALAAAEARPAKISLIGTPEPFDYARLKGRARGLAGVAYQPPTVGLPPEVAALDWDQYQSIVYRADHALWAAERLRFQVRLFHLGLFFREPVHVYEVADGQAREIAYDPEMFDYGKSGLQASHLPRDLGFAGFRIFMQPDFKRDVSAFLGASYFRAVGGEMQYGISARGLAIDTGLARAEEFPRFTAFWLERPARSADTLTVYALLDSPSITGAYRFGIRPGTTQVMDVDAALYPRRSVERLGIAPLTSMYQYGENDRRMAEDWRPEIHDSDGLSMWTGSGEWLWRPLVNPAQLRYSALVDENPKGFGLLQRDRVFDHYQDDGAFYERRPSLWVEPRHGWGKGAVELIELPTRDETFDNIVAFWHPERTLQPGEELLFAYRLYWGARMPFQPPQAHVVATRTGIGGVVGRKREYFSWRFVVDFAGGMLAKVPPKPGPEPVITASSGEVEITSARPLDAIRGYRMMFDLRIADDVAGPIDLRGFLRLGNVALTETWTYQWSPPADRKSWIG
jgi:glucans biosynthesis protein